MFDTWVGKIPWRRAWQPTPVFLPGEFPWTEEPGRLQSMGRKESDTTERLTLFLKDTNTGLSLGHATRPAHFLQRSP